MGARLPGGRLLLLVGLAVTLPTGAESPAEALREGNRLFRAGRLEAAMESYLGGWDPASGDPVLAYNLGTTAHHLGRLPEAVLWYRRAETSLPGDRWLADNLELARRQLRAPRPAPPGLAARIGRPELTAAAAAAALLALGLALGERARQRRSRLPEILSATALALFAAGWIVPATAPRPAVLLEPCRHENASLPAGSEVWARPGGTGEIVVRIEERELSCSAGSVGWIGS